MSSPACHITDGPQYEDDRIERPDGLSIIRSMDQTLAIEYLGDELHERYHNNQSFLEVMRDYILAGDDAVAGKAFRDCLIQAGDAVLPRDIR